MKLTVRLGVRIAIAMSAILVAVLIALRASSGLGNVCAMVPLGTEKGILFSAFRQGFYEITYVTRWPAPRSGIWVGEDWRDMGPYLSWAFFRDHNFAKLGYREGVAMVPLVSAGGPVAYDGGYLRAEELGYPNRLARPPFTVIVNAWRIQFPDGAVVLLAGVIPGCWLAARFWKTRKRALRRQTGLCVDCGYDLRGSSHECPECGLAPAAKVIAPLRRFSRRLSRLTNVSLGLCIVLTIAWLATFYVGVVRQHSHASIVGYALHFETTEYGFTRAGIWKMKARHNVAIPRDLTSTRRNELTPYLASAGVWETTFYRGHQVMRGPEMGLLGDLSLESNRAAGWQSFVVGVRTYLIIALLAILPAMRWWRRQTTNALDNKTSQS